MQIKVESTVNAPMDRVWHAWITPDDITRWNFALDEWCCPSARLEFTVGGDFSYRMEAKDGSMGFDFEGRFTDIDEHQRIAYVLGDDRKVTIDFLETADGIRVTETFDAENENSAEQQRAGWQNILNNFKRYVEEGDKP